MNKAYFIICYMIIPFLPHRTHLKSMSRIRVALSPICPVKKMYMILLYLLKEIQMFLLTSLPINVHSKFKHLAVSTTQCLILLRCVCSEVHKWSSAWCMVINCDVSKTQMICFGIAESRKMKCLLGLINFLLAIIKFSL